MVDRTTKYIQIPMPRATQNLYRGIVGAKTEFLNPISVRWALDDKEFVMKQAEQIGLSFSEFVRWCAIYGAKEIEKLQQMEDFEIKPRRKPREIDISEYE